jgi:hypothetical protein
MPQQVIATPSSKKISDLYRRVKEGSLILQPDFQRRFVWNMAHRESFIDTILQGLPFPEVYVAQRGVDLDTLSADEVVVDGQQRLSTILQYIDEDAESNGFGKSIPKFRELSRDKQRDFLNYNVVVRDLGDIQPDVIKEVFRRINLTKYSLRQVEIHNAVYDGEFINLAKRLVEESKISDLPAFSESGILRMGDLDFALLVLGIYENEGYFSYSNEVEKYIARYNDEYPQQEAVKKRFIRTARYISSLGLEPDSLWYRKSNFLTMFVEFMKLDSIPKGLKTELNTLENNILQNKGRDNEYGQYYAAMFTGTNKRKERIIRADIFCSHILGFTQSA